MQDSLYVIQSEIGNQCSALRSGWCVPDRDW